MSTEERVADESALVGFAIAGEPATPLDKGERMLVRTPHPDGSVVAQTFDGRGDDRALDPTPSRVRGEVRLTEPDSFVHYVNRFIDPAVELYGSVDAGVIVGVLNGPNDRDAPAWGDHRATLGLTPTPAWKHWIGANGKTLSQEAFADHIETGLGDIVEPAAADVLEFAQTVVGTVGVTFRSQSLIGSGQRQLLYSEQVDAQAGRTGELTIPSDLTLSLAPWRGIEPFAVTARIRFRINGGALTLSYSLVRPEDVLDRAFSDVTKLVSEGTGRTVLLGSPPAYT